MTFQFKMPLLASLVIHGFLVKDREFDPQLMPDISALTCYTYFRYIYRMPPLLEV